MKKITFEDLKNYNGFEEIDKKVEFIEKNRHVCEFLIRELNYSIDLDYVKQSEMLERNTDHELKKFTFDENTKVLRSEPYFPGEELLKAKSKEEYYEIIDKQRENSTLIMVKKNKDGTEKIAEFKTPGHLTAVDFALRQARKDRKSIREGKRVPMDLDFVEYVNEKLISHLMADGPTAGYGRFRRVVYRYGSYQELNVRISDGAFLTTPAQYVYDDMENLVKEYNNSELHPILKAIVFKTKFIKIHPFCDFNGRTSRILLNYMLVRYGIPTVTIKGSQKNRYIDAMDAAIVDDDYSKIITLIKNLLNKRCDKYIELIKESANEQNITI